MSDIERILIVDENESNILFFELIFQNLGKPYKVFSATAGAQGELIARNEHVQFIVCAWEMASMSGTVFIQRIRDHRQGRHLPCLIFSKRMTSEEATLIREMGLANILGMPFDKAGAAKLIEEMINAEDHLSPIERKLRRVEGLIGEGKFTEALKFVDPSLTKPGTFQARAETRVGEIWLNTVNYGKAEDSFDRALEIDPEYLEAKRLLAKLYSITSRHDAAITLLKEVTAKSPLNIKSLLCLGNAYVEADRHDEARAVFDSAEKIDPECQLVKDERGKLAFKEENYNLAARLLAETNQGDELARHFNNVAISKVAQGHYDDGIEIYQNAIRLLADKAKVYQLYFNLGLAHRKKGDLVAAFHHLCSSYIFEPNFEKAYGAIAKLAKEMRDAGLKLDPQLVEEVKVARTKVKVDV